MACLYGFGVPYEVPAVGLDNRSGLPGVPSHETVQQQPKHHF
jgi:hypothetical protein